MSYYVYYHPSQNNRCDELVGKCEVEQEAKDMCKHFHPSRSKKEDSYYYLDKLLREQVKN